jgi:hypothetical protein
MWPFRKFRIKFNHDPEMFCLRLVPSWFSSDYINYKYTANGGLTWKYVHCAEEPLYGRLDYDWRWNIISHQFKPSSNFDYEKEKFGSYQKILDYEAIQWKKYTEGDKKHCQERSDYYQRKADKLKELNQC